MANAKNTFKKIGRQIWEFVKGGLPAGIMYCCAGTLLMMLTMKGELKDLKWDDTKLIWIIVCVVAAMAYNALVTYAQGGSAYEMLVSGNMKRVSASDFEGGYKISSHKEAKEYRAWKGFVMGGFIAIFPIITGIIFGCNAEAINATLSGTTTNADVGLAILVIACFMVSGWSILPFYYLNASGIAASYFISCAFGALPVIVTGVMYIVGAYGRRNKAIRAQELADKAAAAEQAKEKKINYGGLPGTKPKKRK